jgi:hypothetical protein
MAPVTINPVISKPDQINQLRRLMVVAPFGCYT